MGGAWRRSAARARVLRLLLKDTLRALQDAHVYNPITLPFDPDIPGTVHEIGKLSSRPTVLVILGSSSAARARLINCLLGTRLLPETLPRGCRWLRIQYGSTTQVHLTVGNSEFELVEDLECNKKSWDTLPLQDILRQDQTDLTTILEVELNNSFLKNGHRIIMPPDIPSDPGFATYSTLKQLHSDLYSKRETILKTLNPVYLYALDSFGRNIFNENMCLSKLTPSKSEEEFWNTFNLYYMARMGSEEKEERIDKAEEIFEESMKGRHDDAAFSPENCLDLHQIKEIDPNSQIFFIMFSDSMSDDGRKDGMSQCEATESTESVGMCNADEFPESDQDLIDVELLRHTRESQERNPSSRRLIEQQVSFMNELLDQWELLTSTPQKNHVKSQWAIVDDQEILSTPDLSYVPDSKLQLDGDRVIKGRATFLRAILKYSLDCAQTHLLIHCTKLSEIHVKLLQQFLLSSFELARELQVVPRNIQYAAQQERQLYETISEKFSKGEKKRELLQIMEEVLQEMRPEVNNMDWSVDDLPCHQDKRFTVSNSIFYSCRSSACAQQTAAPEPESDVEEAESFESCNFDDYEIIHSIDEGLGASESFEKFVFNVETQMDIIRIENGSETFFPRAWSTCSGSSISSKQASLDVQRAVLSKLGHMISLKLINFVDCLKETYFGTLQRCIESLESSCRQELGGRPASDAIRQLLSVARAVDLQPVASFSLLQGLLESLRRMLYRLCVSSDESAACCVLSPHWRRQVALSTVQSLTPARLARLISTQILERLGVAHERYQSALTSLATALTGRLNHTQDIKFNIRRKVAPVFARLCLESTSMCDLLKYGNPELGREIGRGQYGVVYAVRGAWAGRAPVCVKSVQPPDERSYHDLAMEFFYTKSIPAHPRIVRLLGSVVQGGGGVPGVPGVPGVLLLSEQLTRDLHAAVAAGLTLPQRMSIACDIVEGIRYLHSLGLVHRDIKLKNVLLDAGGRAALADLGFCTLGPLLGGSVVGTPVHMAPELLAGDYQFTVDVYAFAILFWYLCAGTVKMPAAFEMFQNKQQLWSKVKRGLRPERLPHFSDDCWNIMTSCWASDPSERALLGDIQPKLEEILRKTQMGVHANVTHVKGYETDDSINVTCWLSGVNSDENIF